MRRMKCEMVCENRNALGSFFLRLRTKKNAERVTAARAIAKDNMSQINGCGTALVSSVGWASIRSGPGLRGRHREAGRRIGRAPSRHTAGAAEPTPGHFHYSDMSMTFSDLVE